MIPGWAEELVNAFELKILQEVPWHFFIAALGIIFFRTFSRFLFFYPARVLQKNLTLELICLLERVSPSRYQHYSKGDLFQHLGSDIDQMRTLIGFVFLQSSNIIVAMCVLLPKISAYHPQLLISIIPILISLLIFSLVTWKNKIFYKRVQLLQGQVQNFIIESFLGKESINTFQSENVFIKKFHRKSLKELHDFYRAGIGEALASPLVFLGLGFSLIWGSHLVEDLQLSKNVIIAFSGYIFLLTAPLMFIVWIGIVIMRSISSWERLKRLISQITRKSHFELRLEEINNFGDEILCIESWNSLNMIEVKDNSKMIIAGKTASGKSFFLLQIAALYKIKGKNISLVTGSPYIFHDTLSANIFFGKAWKDEDWKKALKYLEIFQLDKLVFNKAELPNLAVGENGIELSGGQAKRLSLVRSLVSGSDILIWDDPFSSIDVSMENSIIKKLSEEDLLQSKKIIMTSHRLTSVQYCDDLIFIERGKGIVERGKVKDLLHPHSKSRTYEYFTDQIL